MSLSLRQGLQGIGVHGPTSPRIPNGFACFPRRLSEAIPSMMANPDPLHWSRGPYEGFADENWSEECQGITFDGERFITSSDGTWVHAKKSGFWSNVPNPGWTLNRSPKALYFFRTGTYRFKDDDIDGVFQLGGEAEDHLGDIDFFEGSIYCAVSPAHGGARCLVVQPNPDGGWWSSSVEIATEESGQGSDWPWCAVNPWNGFLYSSRFEVEPDGVREIYAYDRATGEWMGPERTIRLSDPAHNIQGGCFSPRGHLYLACHYVRHLASGSTRTYPAGDLALVGVREDSSPEPLPRGPIPWHRYPRGTTRSTAIRCYSAFNGIAYGEAPVTTLQDNQELEGLCYAALQVDGHEARIHVVLLENHVSAKDNVFVKPYSSPDPDSI
jgi:hypothetical protein